MARKSSGSSSAPAQRTGRNNRQATNQPLAANQPRPSLRERWQQGWSQKSWLRGVWVPALVSCLVLWSAFPPLSWGWLVWLAPLGWLRVCQRPTPLRVRDYLGLWLSGCLFWLLILQGIRLAYWPLVFGWLALSLYLAIYIPLWVWATRELLFRWRWPLYWAAPTCWVGLELVRSYMLTGYSANTLAHTQAQYPLLIQVADQLGGAGLSFTIMLVASSLGMVLDYVQSRRGSESSTAERRFPWSGLAAAVGVLSLVCGYGWWRLAQAEQLSASAPSLGKVLLVQENTPSIFDNYSPERSLQAWDAYLDMTRRGIAEHGPADLIVWPESTFTGTTPWVEQQLDRQLPPELQAANVDPARLAAWASEMEQEFQTKVGRIQAAVADALRSRSGSAPATAETSTLSAAPHLLVGCDVLVYGSERVQRFNSALFVAPDGSLLGRYDKMHLVMFGEYIPLGPLLQWLREMVGLAGMDSGAQPQCFRLGEVRLSPNICFETMMPRVINTHFRQLAAQQQPPELLVNITNDSWFRDSSMLDHHLACAILCAVENRRPLLVAANTGLSAHIAGNGRLVASKQRSEAATIMAAPQADGRWGLVQAVGYPLSWLCALLTSGSMAGAIRRRWTAVYG